jgi:hypothetical protein
MVGFICHLSSGGEPKGLEGNHSSSRVLPSKFKALSSNPRTARRRRKRRRGGTKKEGKGRRR